MVISLGRADILSVLLDVVDELGEELGGGELAHLVSVVVALGVGLVVEKSVLNVGIDSLVFIKGELLGLGVVDSVQKMENLLLASSLLLSEGGTDEENEEIGRAHV